MAFHIKTLFLFLLITNQVLCQSVEPDTIITSDLEVPFNVLNVASDSINTISAHPADNLYEKNWNITNITYSTAKLKAQKDTLHIILNSLGEKFVAPITGKVISGFGTQRRPGHTGTDIKLNAGDSVRSAFDGQIRLATCFSGYGYMVLIRHYNGLETVYAHLSKICVTQNQFVKAGDLVGLGGRTGRATTEHLHFETRLLGEAFNAEKIIDFGSGQLRCNSFYYNRSRVEFSPDDFKDYSHQKNLLASGSEPGETTHYFIKRGDTLSSIAYQFGISIKQICSLNNISPAKILQIGTKLIISQ